MKTFLSGDDTLLCTRIESGLSLIITLLCAGILSSNQVVGAREAGDNPNFVIFFLDDSGYGDYSHNGNPTIQTPQITRLVREGLNFTQFYVTSPACSASRYSLMTGRYPGRSGLGAWVIGPSSKRYLHPEELTLPEALKRQGYKTGIFGKWHLGSPNQKNLFSKDTLPLAHGFDEWVGTNVSHDYVNAMLMESDPDGTDPVDGYRVITRDLPFKHDVCASLTGRCTQAAISFIKRNREDPFLAYIPYNMPHLGIHASDGFAGQSRRGLLGDVMAEIDDGVGRIRNALKDAGLTENTLIIFSSDNGPWIRFQDTVEHPKYGEARMHIGYATPFRDGKGSTWEGGHRVPGIFCWPGMIAASQNELAPVSTLDVFPTLVTLPEEGCLRIDPSTVVISGLTCFLDIPQKACRRSSSSFLPLTTSLPLCEWGPGSCTCDFILKREIITVSVLRVIHLSCFKWSRIWENGSTVPKNRRMWSLICCIS